MQTSATPHPIERITCIRSPDDEAAGEDGRMILMIVIVAGASLRQRRGLTTLAGGEEAYRVDLATVRRGGIRAAGDVVRLHVIVDERHPLANGDDELTRLGS